MKVLLPIDGSDCSQKTLEWVTQLLDKATIDLYLIHILEFIPEIPVSDQDVDDTKRILHDAKIFLENKGFRVVKNEYVIDRAAKAICEYADEQGIEQIIMSSHGRKGLAKVLMGSVSEEVFKKAKQPVLIYNNGPNPSLNISHINQLKMVEKV
jgi:nucleotide-binding universal stress UspA family protein